MSTKDIERSIFSSRKSRSVLVGCIETILVVLALGLIVWDIFLYYKPEYLTISEIIRDKVNNGGMIITYFWGVLGAHFFLPVKAKPWIPELWGIAIMLAIGIVFYVLGRMDVSIPQEIAPERKDLVYLADLVFGFAIGRVFWPQWRAEVKMLQERV